MGNPHVRKFSARNSGAGNGRTNFPVLPLLVFWRKARKTTKKTRIFYSYRTPKIPGKEEKNGQKTRKSSQGKKQGNPKKQGKEGQGLWAPGIFWFFLLENPHAYKIPLFRGGVLGFFKGGGGSANLIFMGAGILLNQTSNLSGHHSLFSVHVLFPQVFEAFIHGFVPQRECQIHTITLMFTIHYLSSQENGSLIAPITFTDSLQSRE